MIEQALRSLCESQHRWLIVISVTLVLGLALLLPLVDMYFKGCQQGKQLVFDLEQANQIAETLSNFEAKANGIFAKLTSYEDRTLTEDSTPELQKRLQTMARDTGCTMRRLNVGNEITRSWFAEDNPLNQHVDKKKVKEKTPYAIQRRPVSLTLYGSMTNLRDMLDSMKQDNMLVHTNHLSLHPDGRSRENVMLEMELWYFALERQG